MFSLSLRREDFCICLVIRLGGPAECCEFAGSCPRSVQVPVAKVQTFTSSGKDRLRHLIDSDFRRFASGPEKRHCCLPMNFLGLRLNSMHSPAPQVLQLLMVGLEGGPSSQIQRHSITAAARSAFSTEAAARPRSSLLAFPGTRSGWRSRRVDEGTFSSRSSSRACLLSAHGSEM